MRRFRFFLPLLLSLAFALSASAAPERRVALVIGNGNYMVKPLKNALNDAKDMADALNRLGFQVTHLQDADKRRMKEAIREFGSRLKRGGVGLFYYAGHGAQNPKTKQNYLIPVGAEIKKPVDMEDEAVDAQMVLAEMEEAENNFNIVILDACRNNPFVDSTRSGARGLAEMRAPKGVLIELATGPGKIAGDGAGRNGEYTEKILKHIYTPGLPVERLFKQVRVDVDGSTNGEQVPWEHSSLLGEFYFAGGLAGGALQPAPVQTAALSTTSKPAFVAPLPKVAEPSAGRVDWDVLERQGREREKAEAAERGKWASWQSGMRAAVSKAEKLEKGKGLSAQQKAEAWLRVASAYTQKNPYSDEDDALRAKINSRADHWSGEAGKEAERQAKGEAARLEAERRRQELAAQKAKAAEEARLAAERMRQEQAQRLEALKAEKLAAPKAEKKAEKIEVAMAGRPSGSPGQTWRDPVTGMEFVWVPKGCFRMGSDEGSDDEKPVHEVCLSGFWLGKFEVTQGQWQKVMGSNPSNFQKGDNYPVEQVSWNDAKEFISRLNSQGSARFRLPTEAEWEYAARSGGKAEKYAGGDDADRVAWYSSNSGSSTHPVGTKAPNGLGLYDMSGNVWEWVEDVYSSSAYSSHSRDNPIYAGGGSYRVYRGGSWSGLAHRARCALRFFYSPGFRYIFLGFRLARTP